MKKSCSHSGCLRPIRANGYCSTHAEQMRLKGSTWDVKQRQTSRVKAGGTDICVFPDCGRSHFKQGYCESHSRQATKGVPLTILRSDRSAFGHDEKGDYFSFHEMKFYFDPADRPLFEEHVWALQENHLYNHRTHQYLHKTLAGLSTHDGYRFQVHFRDGDPTNYRRANLKPGLRTRGVLGERGITMRLGSYQIAIRVQGELIVRRRNSLKEAITVRDILLESTSIEEARRLTNARPTYSRTRSLGAQSRPDHKTDQAETTTDP